MNTHSGTALGVLLDRADPDYPDRLLLVANALSSLDREVSIYRTLSFPRRQPHPGGVRP
ncbi:hypothetical protein HFP72_29415 [Nocardiopsis sp. ARC36]